MTLFKKCVHKCRHVDTVTILDDTEELNKKKEEERPRTSDIVE